MGEPERYDVFVCHRGETKRQLVSHVKARLQRSSLRVFVDFELEKGSDSWQTILESLRRAPRVLVILSPDFESSPWCLEELWAAMQRTGYRSVVLPVFYDRELGRVDDAKLLAAWSEYNEACPGDPLTRDVVLQRWRKALKDVSGIASWVFKSATGCGRSQAEVCCRVHSVVELTGCPVRAATGSRTSWWTRSRRSCCAYSARRPAGLQSMLWVWSSAWLGCGRRCRLARCVAHPAGRMHCELPLPSGHAQCYTRTIFGA